MFNSVEEKELALKVAVTEAKIMSEREVGQLVAISRITRFLSCYHANRSLDRTDNGALILPKELLGQLCIGFAQDDLGREVFCVFFQDYLWQDFKNIPLQLGVLEHEEQSILLRFSELPIGDFKLPHLDISLPIRSNAVWGKLTRDNPVRYITIGHVKQHPSGTGYFCAGVQSKPCKIIKKFKYVG